MTKQDLELSIVIPTYNEEEDIRATLEACVALKYPRKEIIVVDDSNDRTPDIVREYKNDGVRLIVREKNTGGRCGARNEGIRRSKGEVVIILNADVLLPEDFIEKILEYYRKGADYVLVGAEVINQDKLFARFVEAQHRYSYRGGRYKEHTWTEGFSCRREVAISAGLFPMLPLKLTAGEDGYFTKNIKMMGRKKAFDRNIKVRHTAPYKFSEFWKIRRERVSAVANYFLEKKSLLHISIMALLRTGFVCFEFLLIIPLLVRSFLISRYSPRGLKDLIPFVFALAVQDLAFLVGKWRSLFQLTKFLMRPSQKTIPLSK